LKKNIIIIGTGGHATSLVDVIENNKNFKILGFLCNKKKSGSTHLGYKIFGNDNYLTKYKKKKPLVTFGFSSYKNLNFYEKKFLNLKKKGFCFATIVSPLSYVSRRAVLEEGVVIFHGVIINSNCKIARGVTINSKTLIEHDVKIGSFSHISTGCTLNGGVKISNKVFIGSNTAIKENVKVLKKKFIKMFSSVTKNI
jgi:sugar O-acyltransferase (sialic acid O-acetyltransferase NeuD family)